MSHLIVKDLVKSEALDKDAMAFTTGGFFGFGPAAVVNAPVFMPITIITEVSPTINVDLDIANMIGTGFSGVSQ
jgi:high-affinity nickel permease